MPLEHFLFDTKAGYCQHFSGAMALLLRFGGIPTRVATGFSPGGFRKRQGEWVVRDRDAHSWVEAWFDGIGWVTFDPTPTATPARSLIAAIADPNSGSQRDAGGDAPATQPGTRNPAGARRELDPAGAANGTGAVNVDRGEPVAVRRAARSSCSCCWRSPCCWSAAAAPARRCRRPSAPSPTS